MKEASHIWYWYWHRGEIQSCKLTFTNPGLATSTHFTTTVAGEKRVGQRKQDREAWQAMAEIDMEQSVTELWKGMTPFPFPVSISLRMRLRMHKTGCTS